MSTVKLLWQYKWVAFITLVFEWLILAPVLLMMLRFGNKEVIVNLAQTPIGSSNFFGIFIDAFSTSPGLVYAVFAFGITVPTLILFKFALAVGTMASMHEGQWSFSQWLSFSGKHFLRALGLFLRWLIIPAILCGLVILIFKLFDIESATSKVITLAVCWFLSISWLFMSLNGVARNESWSLKNGAITLFKNLHQFLLIVLVFLSLFALAKLMNWQLFVINSDINTTVLWGIIGAFASALFMRIVVLYWQAAHVVVWRKHWKIN